MRGEMVAGIIFRTQHDLREHVRAILYAYPLGASVCESDRAFLCSFFARHERADEKVGVGLASVQVVADSFGGRRFQITRTDASTTDISIEPCLRAITPLARFKATCRRAVVEQVVAFKQEHARGKGEWSVLHVDHVAPLTFDRLVGDFIKQEGLQVERVAYCARGDNCEGQRFADSDLEERWRAYHARRAQLRVISKDDNLRLPKRCAVQEALF